MKKPIDPEEVRWNQTYPRFPGVAKCVELLHNRNVKGTWVDIICIEPLRHAPESADELIAATQDAIANAPDTAKILLHVLSDAKLPQALPLFAELLVSSDTKFHSYARTGLQKLDSKDSRRLLWEHREQ